MITPINKCKATPLGAIEAIEAGKVGHKEIWKNSNGSAILLTFGADASLAEHLAPDDVMIIGIEGSVTFMANGISSTLTPGDVLLMDKATPHSVHADTDAKLLLTKIRP